MIELPRLRCPGCGKYFGPVKARTIPPANTYKECLRRCEKCRIGATNAKNPAKTKFIRDVTPQPAAPQEPPPPQQPPEQKPGA